MSDVADSTSRTYRLPPLQSLCPWEFRCNPHYDAVSRASDQWICGLNVVEGVKLTSLKEGAFSLLASLVFHYATPEALRVCCDYMNILFVVDDITDDEDGARARATCISLLRALEDADHDDGSASCRMMKEKRFLTLNPPSMLSQLVQRFKHFFEGVVEEAKLRENTTILDTVEDYMRLRRANGAALLTWCVAPCALGAELPEVVEDDPVFKEIELLVSDMITWTNDLYSYKKERIAGHLGNNVISVLQHAQGLDLQQALDYVGEHFSHLVGRFESRKRSLPPFGKDVDTIVNAYLDGMQAAVAGNIEWSLTTPRYFGAVDQNIKQSSTIELSSLKVTSVSAA